MTGVLDYSRGYPGGEAIARAGYGGVIRYLPRHLIEGTTTGVQPITVEEHRDLRRHGVEVALVHQHAVKARPLDGHKAGMDDGIWALARALEVSEPLGATVRMIRFAVDFDAQPHQYPLIRDYFAGVNSIIGVGRTGAYAHHRLLTFLADNGVIRTQGLPRSGWQPYAWSTGFNQDGQGRHATAGLFQRLGQVYVAGVLCDVNDVLADDWGQLTYREVTDVAVPWRVARSLDKLLAQLNALAPSRSKVTDGGIGDANHQSRASDHNPWVGPVDGRYLVTARDFTHDPAGGLDCHRLNAWLRTSGDPRIKYIIWDGEIWNPRSGEQPYTGPNKHTSHLHLSVVANIALADDTTAWALGEEQDLNTEEHNALIEIRDALRAVQPATAGYAGVGKWHHGTNFKDTVADTAALTFEIRALVRALAARPAADVDEAALAAALAAPVSAALVGPLVEAIQEAGPGATADQIHDIVTDVVTGVFRDAGTPEESGQPE